MIYIIIHQVSGKRLKNQYYSEKANELNLASESKDTEEEFRLMKNYSMLKKNHQTPISATKLEEHFMNHFKERQIGIPDEVMNPQNYQHLARTQELDSIRVNEEPPEREEILNSRKKMKNGRCKGSDDVYSEQIKYNESPTLISMIIMLMSLVWNLLSTPKSWLHSIINCLYKNKGDKLDPDNYRGLSITSTVSKLFIAIIIDHLKPLYEAMLLPT